MIGKALLPVPSSAKSLPAPAQEKSETSTSAAPVLKADSISERKPELKEEAPAEPPPAVNSVPTSEVSDGPLPRLSRPLSPYPNVRFSPGDKYSYLLLFKFAFPFIFTKKKERRSVIMYYFWAFINLKQVLVIIFYDD